MPMKKREQNKINAVNKICTGFFELLQTKQVGDISMTDISNQVNMKRSTIYGYFGSVKEISDYLLKLNNQFCEAYIKEHFGFLENNEYITELDVRDALTPLFEKIAETPSHYYLIEQLDFTYLPILDTIRDLIKKVVQQCNPNTENVDYYQTAIKYAIYGIILNWLKDGAKDPAERVIDITVKILFTKIR